ncbi:CMRF35-like molecule 1 isoform X1 [Astyanax mexicanus]|uniref:CMRF35-like molecule 1 isoform X1 n=1 Tax=Astyanax mexicanus TaxID=7994 RepID=UPI0020CB0241|nr:CMRF35-like molecule 1 isoform X1 [Astyanax mexicanus]
MMEIRITLHVLCCLLCALSKEEVMAVLQVEGTEGKDLNITCTHSWASTNIKYFCRWNCIEMEVLIRSKGVGRTAQSGRYSLYDRGGGSYTVTIARLMKRDSGKYWCGVERNGLDTFHELLLKVRDAPQVTTPQTSTHFSTKGRWYFIPVCVLAVLVVLVASLMLHQNWENICSALRACSPSTRGQVNTDHVETTPGDQNPESLIYENMEFKVSANHID